MLRRFKDRLGVRRDRDGRMTVADPDATWSVYAALGRLHRREPELAKALFPGIHGFVAESVAANRHGWNAAEREARAGRPAQTNRPMMQGRVLNPPLRNSGDAERPGMTRCSSGPFPLAPAAHSSYGSRTPPRWRIGRAEETACRV